MDNTERMRKLLDSIDSKQQLNEDRQLDEISDEVVNRTADARLDAVKSADRSNRDELMSKYDKFSKNQRLGAKRDVRQQKAGKKPDPRSSEYQNSEPGRRNFGDSVELDEAYKWQCPYKKGSTVILMPQMLLSVVTNVNKNFYFVEINTITGKTAAVYDNQMHRLKPYNGPKISSGQNTEMVDLLKNGESPEEVSNIVNLPVDVVAQFIPESGEQLNELSKDTLKSYARKANVDAMKHSAKSGTAAGQGKWDPESHDKAFKRARGVEKALDKLEEKTELDESPRQSMGGALRNELSKAEPGSKLDKQIKHHNAMVRQFGRGTMDKAPSGYRFDNKGLIRLGVNEKVELDESVAVKDHQRALELKDTIAKLKRAIQRHEDKLAGMRNTHPEHFDLSKKTNQLKNRLAKTIEAHKAIEPSAYSECSMNEKVELDEKAKSKAQQRFMGMVHATQKGESPASKEVADVAKSMKKSDAEDFAATKHKGLPEKVTDECTTSAGSVAPTATPFAKKTEESAPADKDGAKAPTLPLLGDGKYDYGSHEGIYESDELARIRKIAGL